MHSIYKKKLKSFCTLIFFYQIKFDSPSKLFVEISIWQNYDTVTVSLQTQPLRTIEELTYLLTQNNFLPVVSSVNSFQTLKSVENNVEIMF